MSNPLVEFIRARLDEDEEVARATRRNEQFVYGTDRWFASHGNAITSMAPHRAVAEVKAKRQMLDEHATVDTKVIGEDMQVIRIEVCQVCSNRRGVPCSTVRLLALPYFEHRDYRAEWAPDLA